MGLKIKCPPLDKNRYGKNCGQYADNYFPFRNSLQEILMVGGDHT